MILQEVTKNKSPAAIVNAGTKSKKYIFRAIIEDHSNNISVSALVVSDPDTFIFRVYSCPSILS